MAPDSQTETKDGLDAIAGKANLFWGALSQWLALGISIILGLVVQPIYVLKLGEASYGLWGLAASFIGFYGLFDLGISYAVARFLGNAIGARDTKQLNEVASTGKWLLLGAAALIFIFALAIMVPAQHILRISEDYTVQFRLLIILSAISLMISLVMSVYSGALIASEDFIVISCIRIAANAVRSLGGLAMVLAGGGVVSLAVAVLAAGILEQSCLYLRCRARIPQLKTAFSGFRKNIVRALIGFGSMRLVASIAEVVRSRFDIFLVTRFAGLVQAGFYNIALTVFRLLFTAAISAAGVSWPRLNIHFGSGKRSELQAFFLRSSHLVAAITAIMVGFLVGLAPVLIWLWMGPGKEPSAMVLRILVAGNFIDLATNPGIGSLYTTAKHKYFAVQSVIEAIASFGCAYVLGSRLGMNGVAAGIVIPITLIKLTIQPWYVTRNLSISFWKYWVRTIGMSILAASLLSVGLGSLKYCVERWGLWSVPIVTVITLVSTAIVLWRLVLDGNDRARVIFHIKKTIDKIVSITSTGKVFSPSDSSV